MKEVQRFLRYIMPGMASVLMLILMVALSSPERFSAIRESFVTDNGIGNVIGGFLASGALGFILANIYFALSWSTPLKKYIAIDHLSFLEDINDKIEILDSKNETKSVKNLDQRRAWEIITQYWETEIESDDKFKAVHERCASLVDITHSLGTTVTGFIIGLISWIVIRFNPSSPSFGIIDSITLFLWGASIFLFGLAYIRTLRALERISQSTLAKKILEEYKGKNKKVKLYYVGKKI